MIELTQQQALAMEEQQAPLHGEVYVLIRKNVYDLTCSIVGGSKGKAWEDAADNDLIRKGA